MLRAMKHATLAIMPGLLLGLLPACGGKGESSASSESVNVAKPAVVEALDKRAERLAHELIIVDGHIDLPYRLHNLKDEGKVAPNLSEDGAEGNFDAVKAKEGGLDGPFMSIYIPSKHQQQGGGKKLADELIDSVESIVRKWPTYFSMAKTPAALRKNFTDGKISLLLGIENGAALEDDLKNVKHFFDRGVRYITLTHATDNLICDSSYAETRTWDGLSPYGEKVVAEMNRLGILVDISHVSDLAFYDVMKVTTKPVIASHSSMRHFTPGFERNMNDDMVRVLAENEGIVMINFGSTFLTQKAIEWGATRRSAQKDFEAKNKSADDDAKEAFSKSWREQNPLPFASVEDVADHIDHVAKLVGVEHVGFGSDFDGVGDSLPTGLKNASGYPRLIEALLKRGYTDKEIEMIASGNLLRVWSAQNNSSAQP